MIFYNAYYKVFCNINLKFVRIIKDFIIFIINSNFLFFHKYRLTLILINLMAINHYFKYFHYLIIVLLIILFIFNHMSKSLNLVQNIYLFILKVINLEF